MLHIVLHLLVPAAVALVFFRPRAVQATLVMLATMLVDLDHLLADPIYDPARCSIGFHPMHTPVPILGYAMLLVISTRLVMRTGDEEAGRAARTAHWVALGLLLHMLLDGSDCLL